MPDQPTKPQRDPEAGAKLRQAFANTFGTPEGQVVLKTLRQAAQYDATAFDLTSPRTTDFILGKQDLFRFIERQLKPL